MTTNTIYKAGSSPLTVTKVAKPAYAPTVSNSTRVRAFTPGTDTTQPVALVHQIKELFTKLVYHQLLVVLNTSIKAHT